MNQRRGYILQFLRLYHLFPTKQASVPQIRIPPGILEIFLKQNILSSHLTSLAGSAMVSMPNTSPLPYSLFWNISTISSGFPVNIFKSSKYLHETL